jgi:hypothetical protein
MKERLAKFWQRTAFVRSGIGLVIVVVALAGLRLLWLQLQHPAHFKEITNAFGSVHLFFGAPQMNHDGSQLTYVATDDKRYALFLCDTATGRKQEIVRDEDGPANWERGFDFHALPWSPDDSAFIYSLQRKLVICPADTNMARVELAVGPNAVSGLVWLNPSEFAWLQSETIRYAKKPANGKWEIHNLPHQDGISSLTAVDAHTIAWLQGDYICHLDLAANPDGTNNPVVAVKTDDHASPLTNGLALWLDASTLQQSNQTPVITLADLSPQKNSVRANRNTPTYNATNSPNALNGKGTIHFESGAAIVNATGLKTVKPLGIAGSQPRSIFVVMKRAVGKSMMINIGDTAVKGNFFGISDQNDNLYVPSGWYPGGKNGRTGKLPASWHMLETIYDGKTATGYVNGKPHGTQTFPFHTVDKEVEIGLRTFNNEVVTNAEGSDGDFAELLIYDRALSQAEQQQVEDYLNIKWFGLKELPAQSSFLWINPGLSGLTGFDYSKETGQLLISRTENKMDSLWRLDAKAGDSTEAVQILQGRFITGAQWAGPNEIAYASEETDHSGLMLADLSGSRKDQPFGNGNVETFKVTSDGKQLFMLGSVSNEPSPGIWQYDLVSNQLRSPAPCSDYPSIHAKNYFPSDSAIKLPSGRKVDCFIYPPLNFNPHKKYPLVIVDTTYLVKENGEPEQQWLRCAAACGAYVVIVNRKEWDVGLDQWGDNVMGVYQSLIQNHFIDASRVYLAGSSAETEYMGKFVAQFPGLWKGVAFLNPGGLPDFSSSPRTQSRPRILVMASSEEHEEDRLKHFQQESLNYGFLVDVVIHADEGHRIIGNAARLERTQAMMHFIFEE